MPTKKRRVGFIPRSDVLEIINKLKLEHNLSSSKIINMLVEEALIKRGLFDPIKVNEFRNDNLLDKNKRIIEDNLKDPFIDFKNSSDATRTVLSRNDNSYSIDLEIYKKFIMFLQFQEKMKKSNI